MKELDVAASPVEISRFKKEAVDLNIYQIQPEALRLIPEHVARKYRAIPLSVIGNTLQVAMSEDNIIALQELAAVARMRIEPVLAVPLEIQAAIDSNYQAYRDIEKELNGAAPGSAAIKDKVEVVDVSDAPVVRALDLIMSEAVKVRASDIHIEPQADRIRVRYRIDGMLHDTMSLPLSSHTALLSRIKVLGNMNIADHRPQDGQFSIKARNQDVDIRVATIDTIYGEMGSLRILDKAFAARELSQLGFLPASLRQYLQMLKSPLGMILISGPTGSGKTTTLYASINSLDRVGRHVVTIEDPVEYRFKDINQIQVNARAGLTFATGLRSIMRHDPDVVMVGEIRDSDTAEIATQAALTGQLVLSSVHANDTVGAFFRMMDLGIGAFLISATLIGVVSQRMVRRVCQHCARPVQVGPDAQAAYSNELGDVRTEFLYGKGCNACADTGYLGRVAVFEIMIITQEVRAALAAGASADELRSIAKKCGMTTMWRDGMLKVKENITTPGEVMRNVFCVG